MSSLLVYLVLSSFFGVDIPAQVSQARNASLVHLRKLDIQPPTAGLRMKIPEGTLLNDGRAKEVALQAQQELRTQGYLNALVDYELTPVSTGRADLHLLVKAGEHVRVKEVAFSGDLGLTQQELQRSLRALHARRILPGWRILPSYTPAAVQYDLARVQSSLIAHGYFDSSVRLDGTDIAGKDAHVRIHVDSGPHYDGLNAPALCSGLLNQRRQAQREGILEFQPTLHVPSLDVSVEHGQPYRVGRIEFHGDRHYGDTQLRRAMLLEEGDLFDEKLLRKSIARIDRGMLFEPIDESRIGIHTDRETGIADIAITLTERKRGSWLLSGPVGPASFAGPVQASISTRLPSFGSRLLNLSAFTASLTVSAFAHPLFPATALLPKYPLFPIAILQRPFSPAEGWKSGFAIIPQLGWRATAFTYPVTQLQERLLPVLAGDRGLVPELPVKVEGTHTDAVLFCEPPKPRMSALRDTAGIALRLAGTLTGL